MKNELKERLDKWYSEHQEIWESETFSKLSEELGQLYANKTIFPYVQNVFKAFELCPYPAKVIFVGQDPYHNTTINRRTKEEMSYATGLCFANDFLVPKFSPSLMKVKEAVIKQGYMCLYEDLENWAKDGVLLLNSSLTVQKAVPGSHSDLWKPFMELLICDIAKKQNPIFVLMGSKANHFFSFIKSKNSDAIIHTLEHPARSCYENRAWDCGTLFIEINKELVKRKEKQIRW